MFALKTNAQYANIIIYSEQDENFKLYNNGNNLNKNYVSKVTLVGVNKGDLKIKIVFENTLYGEIEKYIYALADTETVYRIKKKKNGTNTLQLYSKSRIPINYMPASIDSSNIQTHEIVIINVEKNTETPLLENENIYGKYTEINNEPLPCKGEMSKAEFDKALNFIKNTDFESEKFIVAKQIIHKYCLTTEQVRKIAGSFDFEHTKLEFAKAAYTRTTDKKNYSRVNDVFELADTILILDKFVKNSGK